MFDKYIKLNISTTKRINIPPTEYLLKTTIIETYFKSDLPTTFEQLQKPIYIGATDMYTAKLILFHEGKLIPAIL
jgi:predicted acylesterase/phospholipase RssA